MCALRWYVKSLYRHLFLGDISKHARVTQKKWHFLICGRPNSQAPWPTRPKLRVWVAKALSCDIVVLFFSGEPPPWGVVLRRGGIKEFRWFQVSTSHFSAISEFFCNAWRIPQWFNFVLFHGNLVWFQQLTPCILIHIWVCSVLCMCNNSWHSLELSSYFLHITYAAMGGTIPCTTETWTHIVAVRTSPPPPFLLCRHFWYQLVAYCVCFQMICEMSL